MRSRRTNTVSEVGRWTSTVKYGSEFDRYHTIYFDRKGLTVTLKFGVHLNAGLFIAANPRMHTPVVLELISCNRAGQADRPLGD